MVGWGSWDKFQDSVASVWQNKVQDGDCNDWSLNSTSDSMLTGHKPRWKFFSLMLKQEREGYTIKWD